MRALFSNLFGIDIKMTETWIAKAIEAGFDAAGKLDCSTLNPRPEVRAACEIDKCRRYGKSWSCPPGCGSLNECAARIRSYANGLIVQTIATLEDEFDGEGMMEAAQKHAQSFDRLAKALRKDYPNLLPLGTQSCSNCDACTYPDAPCRDPHGASAPMEAFGLMVNDVCRSNDLEYYHGKGTITFTACFLLE
jgi:predicted metal-binding protein